MCSDFRWNYGNLAKYRKITVLHKYFFTQIYFFNELNNNSVKGANSISIRSTTKNSSKLNSEIEDHTLCRLAIMLYTGILFLWLAPLLKWLLFWCLWWLLFLWLAWLRFDFNLVNFDADDFVVFTVNVVFDFLSVVRPPLALPRWLTLRRINLKFVFLLLFCS